MREATKNWIKSNEVTKHEAKGVNYVNLTPYALK